jgi:uncharacterized protein (DUF2147 family)
MVIITSYLRPAAAIAFAAVVQAAAAAPAVSSAPAAPGSLIEGVWLTAAKSEITVTPCPDDYCGAITKIVVPDDLYQQNKAAIDAMGATSFKDQMNKDPALRGRPILGLTILKLHPGNKPQIYDGEIYNPQDGNTYSGYIEVLGPNKIRLNGCILYNIICKGEDWTRVPQPEPDSTAASVTPSKPAHAATAGPSAAGAIQAGSFQ